MKKKEIDNIDVQILRILASNSKLSNQQLSEMIGLTPSPTLHRVDNLRRKEYLLADRAQVNYEKLGFTARTAIIAQYFGVFHDKLIPPLAASPRVITLIVLSENHPFDVRWMLAIIIGKDRKDLNRELRTIMNTDVLLNLHELEIATEICMNGFTFDPKDILEVG